MFSAADVQDIIRSVPPERTPSQNDSLPSLLLSSTGQGFVATDYVLQNFERMVTSSEAQQIPIADIGKELETEPDAVLQFVEASPSIALLSRDKVNVVPRNQRNSIQHHLQKQLTQGLVSRADFSRESNISLESLEALVQMSEDCEVLEDGHLTSKAYQDALAETMMHQLNDSLREVRTLELSSASVPGTPPIWYISQVLNSLLHKANMTSEFHITKFTAAIRCTPRSSVVQKRDVEVFRLRDGDIPCLDVHRLFNNFREIYTSLQDVNTHLASFPEIDLHGSTAISHVWLSNFGDSCVDAVKVLGYADLTSKIRESFPSECHNKLFEKLETHILEAYSQSTAPDQSGLHRAGDYLLTSVRYETDRELLLHAASAQATHQWQHIKESPERELKFQLSEMFAFIPEEQSILRAVSEDGAIKKSIEEQYWGEISNLELQNELEFSTFWTRRVVARIGNYIEGHKAIEDAKLKDQLSDLLSNYLAKDLLRDSISKARSQGLVCSRKTKKNMQKLEGALQKTSDLSSVLSAVEKFNNKQGVHNATSLVDAKNGLTDDMTRKIQKQSDGPTLFLLLVTILFARHHPGVIYATGRFAPKLLKLLKPTLNTETYETLEKWKDMAKAGSLTREDRDGMKRMAGEAS